MFVFDLVGLIDLLLVCCLRWICVGFACWFGFNVYGGLWVMCVVGCCVFVLIWLGGVISCWLNFDVLVICLMTYFWVLVLLFY